jgi:3'-5' exoribonuclease
VPDGELVVACYSILELKAGRTRGDESFLRLLLADCYGTVEARLWTDVESALAVLRPGLYVGVRGRIERYHDERQLNIERIAPLHVDLDDLVLFLPRSSRAAEVMEAELRALIGSIADPSLRQLVLALIGPKTEVGPGFRLAPAAKQHHHAYLGGLLEHTISVARVCDLLASHYGPRIDRDLLLAGALLHDVGKVREIGARAGFPYTDEGSTRGPRRLRNARASHPPTSLRTA